MKKVSVEIKEMETALAQVDEDLKPFSWSFRTCLMNPCLRAHPAKTML